MHCPRPNAQSHRRLTAAYCLLKSQCNSPGPHGAVGSGGQWPPPAWRAASAALIWWMASWICLCAVPSEPAAWLSRRAFRISMSPVHCSMAAVVLTYAGCFADGAPLWAQWLAAGKGSWAIRSCHAWHWRYHRSWCVRFDGGGGTTACWACPTPIPICIVSMGPNSHVIAHMWSLG